MEKMSKIETCFFEQSLRHEKLFGPKNFFYKEVLKTARGDPFRYLIFFYNSSTLIKNEKKKKS